jgi:hypothetical protein
VARAELTPANTATARFNPNPTIPNRSPWMYDDKSEKGLPVAERRSFIKDRKPMMTPPVNVAYYFLGCTSMSTMTGVDLTYGCDDYIELIGDLGVRGQAGLLSRIG